MQLIFSPLFSLSAARPPPRMQHIYLYSPRPIVTAAHPTDISGLFRLADFFLLSSMIPYYRQQIKVATGPLGHLSSSAYYFAAPGAAFRAYQPASTTCSRRHQTQHDGADAIAELRPRPPPCRTTRDISAPLPTSHAHALAMAREISAISRANINSRLIRHASHFSAKLRPLFTTCRPPCRYVYMRDEDACVSALIYFFDGRFPRRRRADATFPRQGALLVEEDAAFSTSETFFYFASYRRPSRRFPAGHWRLIALRRRAQPAHDIVRRHDMALTAAFSPRPILMHCTDL